MNKTNYQKFVETRLGMSIEQKILQCLEAGMTDAEIARAMDVPAATAKSWRHKYIVVKHELREPATAGR